MKTRQTKRKQSNVPGRYLAGNGEPQDVVLRDVSVGGCRFEMGQRAFTLGSPLQIVVAGTGPHRAIVKWIDKDEVGLTFERPLSQAQVDSFMGSHVPDPSQSNAGATFTPMQDAKPQRFC
ncbi:hypothetical protein NAP1_14498 [Erythrobacter sp. NAP1]|uniref:PilZ domain-containing protein n=1 Tax=Erythrobacter sp. NAP1 TaxID=237727 RepID=UPI0000687745|nr:PilZ domain-containing protein [Erythrobacter sp. NAP1]EAQ28817.1 hypothetical protein NAP1_14498 [Erythrobacter sp. NAP1]